ncbi:MAG: hypothetical protein K6L60_00300 [Oceanobacter sp.]
MNSLFRVCRPTWANALVGDNGSPGYREYFKGYSKAANHLLEIVKESENEILGDELVYPICFNMRHSIELRLKYILSETNELASRCKKCPSHELKLTATHSIYTLWESVNSVLQELDRRFTPLLDLINPFVSEISSIDENGQIFRYPYGQDKFKHLSDYGGGINLINLMIGFRKLEALMDELDKMFVFIVDEYRFSESYTKEFSRADLYQIARMLPNKSTWSGEEFASIKESLRVKYGVSGRKLSRGIKLIEKHYQFAPLIGLQVDLLGLSEQALVNILKVFLTEHPEHRIPISERVISVKGSNNISLEELLSAAESRFSIEKYCKHAATVELVSGITALFYLAYDGMYSEDYINRYNIEFYELSHASREEIVSSMSHVVGKYNLIKNVMNSLWILNKPEMIRRLISELGLEGCVDIEEKLDIICIPSDKESYGYV